MYILWHIIFTKLNIYTTFIHNFAYLEWAGISEIIVQNFLQQTRLLMPLNCSVFFKCTMIWLLLQMLVVDGCTVAFFNNLTDLYPTLESNVLKDSNWTNWQTFHHRLPYIPLEGPNLTDTTSTTITTTNAATRGLQFTHLLEGDLSC